MATPKASNIFHFTKSVDVLKSILQNGFYPRFSLEDVSWLGISNLDYVSFAMACFCDIPIGRISDHVAFYGSYGLGMSKEWALKNRLNPVSYIAPNSVYGERFLASIRGAITAGEAKPSEDYFDHMIYMLAYAKPISGQMIVNTKPLQKDFYQENEWRFVPHLPANDFLLMKPRWDDEAARMKRNAEIQAKSTLKLVPSDVRYIFVPTDADIPALVNFINEKLDAFPSADLKILTTRVTSLEWIEKDM